MWYSFLEAFYIRDGRIENAKIFRTKDKTMVSNFSILWDANDWRRRANIEGNQDWIMRYDNDSKAFYVPVPTDTFALTDKYEIYRFANDSFNYVETKGGHWLNPRIRDFLNLEVLFPTKHYIIRLDRVKDGVYRYCSWKKPKTMIDIPDITLKGRFDSSNSCFWFTDNGEI